MDFVPGKPTFEMHTCKISRIKEENYRIKTFEFAAQAKARPGQFIMIWIPGVGERPMSLGSSSPLSVTIANVGKFSGAIHLLKEGSLISFRGPIGKPFSLKKGAKKILLVGGGYGVVPLAFLAREAKKQGIESIAVIGARKKEDIIFLDKFKESGTHVEVTTDDGSLGTTGNALHGVETLFREGIKFDAAYSCGPEKMMYHLAKMCQEKGIYCEVSVERYMKCGINICGACAVDGKICCRDGPIFNAKEALKFSEFGNAMRDASGKKSSLH
jgi:dihydroorotate dehydrogenase electron transfer subunit